MTTFQWLLDQVQEMNHLGWMRSYFWFPKVNTHESAVPTFPPSLPKKRTIPSIFLKFSCLRINKSQRTLWNSDLQSFDPFPSTESSPSLSPCRFSPDHAPRWGSFVALLALLRFHPTAYCRKWRPLIDSPLKRKIFCVAVGRFLIRTWTILLTIFSKWSSIKVLIPSRWVNYFFLFPESVRFSCSHSWKSTKVEDLVRWNSMLFDSCKWVFIPDFRYALIYPGIAKMLTGPWIRRQDSWSAGDA